MPYFVYILKSEKTNKYYIGYTADLQKRVEKHNLGGTKSTKSGLPWTVVYYEVYDNKSQAIKREFEIKRKKSRKYITSLILSKHEI